MKRLITLLVLLVTISPVAVAFDEGDLLRPAGQPRVYVITNGQRHAIPNMAAFGLGRFAVANVRDIEPSVLEAIPEGPWYVPEGLMFADECRCTGHDTLYLLRDGKKLIVADMALFHRQGLDDRGIAFLPRMEIDRIPTGAYWIPDGSLIVDDRRTPDVATVYLIENSRRRAIPNLTTFHANGWRDDEVASVPAAAIAQLPLGAPIAVNVPAPRPPPINRAPLQIPAQCATACQLNTGGSCSVLSFPGGGPGCIPTGGTCLCRGAPPGSVGSYR